MEDREFFRELCMTVLEVDSNIRFAGVVNDEGVLVVGEYRKDIKSPLIQTSAIATKSGGQGNVPETENAQNIGRSSFHVSKMTFALNKQFENELGQLNYNLADYDKVKLLTIALSNRSSHYLCVSIDPMEDCQPVITKIIASI